MWTTVKSLKRPANEIYYFDEEPTRYYGYWQQAPSDIVPSEDPREIKKKAKRSATMVYDRESMFEQWRSKKQE